MNNPVLLKWNSTQDVKSVTALHTVPRLPPNFCSGGKATARLGRAIAQEVSRRVQTRVWSCRILWWTKVALGQVFLRELRFPLPIYIPSASSQSSSLSTEAGTIRQEWPQCQQSHKPNKKKMLITVAARSKPWTVFARLNTGIVGSNPIRDIDVYLLLFCVCVR
jgi:hypothetical protein